MPFSFPIGAIEMNTFKRYLSCATVWTAACLLTACGGHVVDGGGSPSDGGGGSAALSLTPQSVKTFHFSWAAVAGATSYVLLEDPDGQSGYTAVATLPAGTRAYDHEVFLPARVNARYALQVCNANGCANRASVDASGHLAGAIGYVKASAQSQNMGFGARVAMSGDGNTLAVGASGDGSDATGTTGTPDPLNHGSPNSGAVYVFARSGSGWVQQAYLKASNHDAGDMFGDHLALSADGAVLAVSAVGEDGFSNSVANPDPVDNSAPNAGAVYVFRRSGAAWNQEAYVKASNGEAGDAFGTGLALSGDGATLAVGAPSEQSNATGINGNQHTNNGPDFGAVYVFVHNGIGWAQQAYVKASNAGSGDLFGASVALSNDGNVLAASAPGEDGFSNGVANPDPTDNSAPNAGAVYMFRRGGATWSQEAYVKASNGETGDAFGTGLALSGDGATLAVGAPAEQSGATGINGNQHVNNGPDFGAVYVFTYNGTGWAQQAYVKASNAGSGDQFGVSVALSNDGNALAVGAWQEGSHAAGLNGIQTDNSLAYSGAVYTFARQGSTWAQQAYVKASNPDANDQFGGSVALGGGSGGRPLTLAVGAVNESSSATGVNGNPADNSVAGSGAAYLY